ncbi:hypothetical protein CEN41_02695 [Fischerella thermalis CCMEE 5330]|uniref:Uncharacterized protein n=1 Tax=Fischerella thermalis CCMEE 5330 TaxID=2019670 RepID=A0A2N6MMA4_9CYAN|nr:hypothetical protein CEN41_02695 [Fischerella thermalis CCMEE 5330]
MFKPHQLPWLVLLRFLYLHLTLLRLHLMIFQLNLAAIFAVTAQTDWKKAKPCVIKGEILEVSFPHPRDRACMRNSKQYYDLRNYALNFLERNFTTDEYFFC